MLNITAMKRVWGGGIHIVDEGLGSSCTPRVSCHHTRIFHLPPRSHVSRSATSGLHREMSESKDPAPAPEASRTGMRAKSDSGILRSNTAASSMPHTFAVLTVVVVGASGDLAKKKTYPSLLKLFKAGYLPVHTRIVGFARSDYSDESFRERLRSSLAGKIDEPKVLEIFLQMCFYQRGRAYDDAEAWKALHASATSHEQKLLNEDPTCTNANRMFYYAIPPNVFAAAGGAIKAHAMGSKGWNRMIVEKPFGRDSESSEVLAKQLGALFNEDQLYRIDHYLGKELVQNLLVLRFGNIMLQPLWNRQYIKSVIISFKEDIGTQGRGGYFDNYGIIRDVMQNHLLQILSLIIMEPPVRVSGPGYSKYVRDEKVKALHCIPPLKLDDVILGQYTASGDNEGYLDDPTVPEGALCPTYALAKFQVNNARWDGVPFIIKCGKGLNSRKAEVRVQFHPPAGSAAMFDGAEIPLNELVIRVQPNDAIYFKCNVKT